jgi:hypothetical protein
MHRELNELFVALCANTDENVVCIEAHSRPGSIGSRAGLAEQPERRQFRLANNEGGRSRGPISCPV